MSRKPSSKTLAVLLEGRAIGAVTQNAAGSLAFEYDEGWIEAGPGIPLSLSMPLQRRRHGDDAIAPFMWGLLPDNETTLQRLGREFGVSPRSAFALLGMLGEDCAGAVQFIAPERIECAMEEGGVDWIDEAEVGRRIAALKLNRSSTGRTETDRGHFSLAGAQPKTALHRDGDRWGVPFGRVPTTHILKPPIPDLDGHVENEHFCLRLAAKAGFPTAMSEVMDFVGETVIVVARYDRAKDSSGVVHRIHQEDMCQALKVHPERKYEKEGGPGIVDIMNDALNASSRPDVDRRTFMRAIAFNFVIGATDTHAKNFSVLLGANGAVRLAPLYDIASILPYTRDPRKIRMPLKIGGYYELDAIMPRHWERTARDCSYPANDAIGDVSEMAQTLPDLASDVAADCREAGLGHPVIDNLVEAIARRSSKVRTQYK